MENNKELFDYWHDKVRLRNNQSIAAPGHIQTHDLRHDCTNYDALRESSEVRSLQEQDRSKVIAIIKYECTAQVLQRRAGVLREQASKYETLCHELNHEKSNFHKLIKALQEKLFGKDKEIQKLEAKIAKLEAENKALQAETENSKAYAELLDEFEAFKKRYEKTEKRRQELAKNNMSLDGKVRHTNRFREERDEARAVIKEQKLTINQLDKENKHLCQENEKLRVKLKIGQDGSKLEIVEIRRHETT